MKYSFISIHAAIVLSLSLSLLVTAQPNTGLPGLSGPPTFSGPTGPGFPSGFPSGLPSGPPNGNTGNNNGTGNDDTYATIALTNETYAVYTSNPSLTITVLRMGNNVGECTVNFTTADGTAVSGIDYGGGSGMLVWADGNMDDQPVTLQINPEMLTGTQKNFSFILYGPFQAYLGYPNVAAVTIYADAIWAPPTESSSSSTGSVESSSSSGGDITIAEVDNGGGGTDYAKVLGLSIGLGGGGLLLATIGGLSYWQLRKRRGLAANANGAVPDV